MIQLFKSSQAVVLLFLAVYTFLLHFYLLLTPPQLHLQTAAPIGQLIDWVIKSIPASPPYILPIVYTALVYVQALLLNLVLNRYRILGEYNYLAALCFVLLCAWIGDDLYYSPPFFANFFMLLALDKVNESADEIGLLHSFDAGFLVGLASLCYLPTAVLLLFVVISLNINRFFNWRELLLVFAGAVIVYFLTFVGYFFVDELPALLSHFTHIVNAVTQTPVSIWANISKVLGFALVFGISIVFFQRQYYRSIVRVRNGLTILVYLLAISILSFLFMSRLSFAPVVVLLLPLTGLLAYSFSEIKTQRIAELLHILLLVIAIWVQYFA
ncbi:MAG TPA: hypothetical protein PKH93_04740 [Chitinophagales bacterium]|nr:hypothetical protein [Chitinophagales bacterium]